LSPFKFTLGFWANADPLSAIDKTVKLITARDADGAGTLDPSDLADNRADRSRSCRDHHRFTNGAQARLLRSCAFDRLDSRPLCVHEAFFKAQSPSPFYLRPKAT
jgi:hypothetical protein